MKMSLVVASEWISVLSWDLLFCLLCLVSVNEMRLVMHKSNKKPSSHNIMCSLCFVVNLN